MKMRRCEDEKMFYRRPLLEEPCAQTLSGIKKRHVGMVLTGGGLKRDNSVLQGKDQPKHLPRLQALFFSIGQ